MTAILHLFGRCCWLTFAIGVVALALLLTLARLLVPLAGDGSQAWVERQLSDRLGVEVAAGGSTFEWQGFGPRLRLTDVTLVHPGGDAIHLDAAAVRIAPGPGLSGLRELAIRDVTLSGLDLALAVDDQGRVDFWGTTFEPAAAMPAPPQTDEPGDAPTLDGGPGPHPGAEAEDAPGDLWARLLTLDRLKIADSQLRVVAADGEVGRIDDLDLRLTNRAGRHRLALTLTPPTAWGRSLGLVVEARYLLDREREPVGTAYIAGQDLRLVRWAAFAPVDLPGGVIVTAGEADVAAWVDWHGSRLASATFDVAARDVFAIDGAGDRHAATSLSSVLAWARDGEGWQARLGDFELIRGDRVWRAARAGLDHRGGLWRARGDVLELAEIASWAPLLPLTEAHAAGLAALVPQGRLNDFALAVHEQGGFQAAARFRDLGWSPVGDWPAFTGLDGELRLSPRGGEIELDTRGARFEHPELFRQALELERITGPIRVERTAAGITADATRLRVDNPDVTADARIHLDVPHTGSPWLDMQVDFRDADAAAQSLYLPVGIMFPELIDWLDRAIVDGHVPRGRMLFHGRLRDFPFRDHSGVFEVDFDLVAGELDYAPGWPEVGELDAHVRFHGPALDIHAHSARIYDSPIGEAHARFADLEEGELEITAAATPRMSDLLRLVQDSPLKERLGAFFDGAESDPGMADLELALDIPVDRAAATQVDGRLGLAGNAFVQPRFGVDLDQIEGAVRFTADTLAMTDVRAQFHGQPVRLDATTRADALHLRARGDIALGPLLPDSLDAIATRFDGAAPWDLEIRLAGQGPSGLPAQTHIRAESSLAGTAIRLPAPLRKTRTAERPLRIDLPLVTGADEQALQLRYGDAIALAAGMELGEQGSPTLTRGLLRFGGSRPEVPRHAGWAIEGELDELDLAPWWRLFANGDGIGAVLDAGAPAASGQRLAGLQLELGRLRWDARVLTDAGVTLDPAATPRRLELASNEAIGHMEWPAASADGGPLRLRFDHIDLAALRAEPEREPMRPQARPAVPVDHGIEPDSLPPFDIHIGRLVLDCYTLEDVAAASAPSGDGMQLHRLDAGNDHLEISGHGDWQGTEDGDRTRLSINLAAADFGAGLTALGLAESGFVGGSGRIATQLEWQGPPWAPQLKTLVGETVVRLADGLVTTVDPGPVRLISLFSLQALPRRLALDFSSLLRSGFEYDRIDGRLHYADGHAHVDHLAMVGPPGRAQVSGRIGYVARDFDQLIEFRPGLAYSLPVIGAIAGGPMTGVTVALFQQLLRGIGADLEAVAEVRYALTGTWDEPTLDRVRSEAADVYPDTLVPPPDGRPQRPQRP